MSEEKFVVCGYLRDCCVRTLLDVSGVVPCVDVWLVASWGGGFGGRRFFFIIVVICLWGWLRRTAGI